MKNNTMNSHRNVRHVRGRRANYGIKMTFYLDDSDKETTVKLRRTRKPLVTDLENVLRQLRNQTGKMLSAKGKGVIKCTLYRLETNVSLTSCTEPHNLSDDSILAANSIHKMLKPKLSSMWNSE